MDCDTVDQALGLWSEIEYIVVAEKLLADLVDESIEEMLDEEVSD